MIKLSCDWCYKDIKGKPNRYARHHFCLNGDCKKHYRRYIEGKIHVEPGAATVIDDRSYFVEISSC
jgi:hypothetical protein